MSRGLAFLHKSFLLIAISFAPGAAAQSANPEPLSKERLMQTLELLKGDAADALVAQVQQRGVSFQMTSADEQDLKKAGASGKLISAIRKSFRPAAAPAPPAPAVAPPPSGGLPGTGPAALPGTAEPSRLPPAGMSPSASQAGSVGRALVLFYGTCPKGAIVVYNATISSNGQELAKLSCDSFFYSVASPGPYTFCVNKKKCQTADIRSGLSYYFHVPAKMIGYGLDPVPVHTGDLAVQSLAPLESKRVIARDFVSVDSAAPPASVLTPGSPDRRGRD